jgi:hypothetical protein
MKSTLSLFLILTAQYLFSKNAGCEAFRLIINGETFYHGPNLAVFEVTNDTILVEGKFGGSCHLKSMMVFKDSVCIHSGNGFFKIPPEPGIYMFRGFSNASGIDWIPVEVKATTVGLAAHVQDFTGQFKIIETENEVGVTCSETPAYLVLTDAMGKIIVAESSTPNMTIRKNQVPGGLYIISAEFAGGRFARKKLFLRN